jgi:hypothetical protein
MEQLTYNLHSVLMLTMSIAVLPVVKCFHGVRTNGCTITSVAFRFASLFLLLRARVE